jgi:tetratricopeptide (TPR) repeat protein
LSLTGILTAFYAIRGEAYLQKADYPHALEDYDKAIELAPFAQAFANRAEVLERMGRMDDADRDRERAGFYHLAKGECDKALPDYDLALTHNPKIAAALYGRGLCKIRSGDTTAGSNDLSAARAIDANIDTKYDWPK